MCLFEIILGLIYPFIGVISSDFDFGYAKIIVIYAEISYITPGPVEQILK